MKKIIHFFHVKTVPDEVYRALTTRDGLAGWWSSDVEVSGGSGGQVNFRFIPDVFNPTMKVTKLEASRSVHWQCVGGHDNWQDNTFSFELEPHGDSTTVLFTQVYARELSDQVYGEYNFNWGHYLGSLKRFCETGSGEPFRPG